MSDSQREGWHLKKEIQVTHIISTVMISVGAILYVGDIKRDVEVLKAKQDLQDRNTNEAVRLLREQLAAMDKKLDRLIEGRARP